MKERRNDIIEKQEIILKLYSPLAGDFYHNDTAEYEWNNGAADYPTMFSGGDKVCYEDSIRRAVEQRNNEAGGNLIQYFISEYMGTELSEKMPAETKEKRGNVR